MALGADDGQATGGKHALALGLAGLLGLGVKLLELLGRHVLHGQALVLKALAHQLVGVAAQQDVGTTTGHVGSDGHGAVASGLGNDMSLALVMLALRTSCAMPRLVRAADSFSELSMETVPTRTGWPLA